jgi:putative phosphoesterase
MRILVLSDSHGAVDNMRRAVRLVRPDHILFLGDCLGDAARLRIHCRAIPMDVVPGNCDGPRSQPAERLLRLGGHAILMMHGHTRGVKRGLMNAVYAAREQGAEVLLFGHTHRPLLDYDGTLYTMNPGAAGDRFSPTCGVITIEGDSLRCDLQAL